MKDNENLIVFEIEQLKSKGDCHNSITVMLQMKDLGGLCFRYYSRQLKDPKSPPVFSTLMWYDNT